VVVACTRDRVGQPPYCQAHEQRLRDTLRKDPGLDVERWHATATAIVTKGEISLRGLHPRVVAEVLYGLQERLASGGKTPEWLIRRLCDQARVVGATSVADVPPESLSRPCRQLRADTLKALALIGGPEAERDKDVWNLTVFGARGTARFTGISQPWLRAATKLWAAEDLPKRRGHTPGRGITSRIRAICAFSDSLRLQRPDRGNDLTALSRQDITAFANRLAYLVAQGMISAVTRVRWTRFLRGALDSMRAMGLTRSGQPLYGFPEDVRITAEDLPHLPEEFEAGRDLPGEVMQHLCAHLPILDELFDPQIRVAIELLIDTGRRRAEICTLALDCLERDADGRPVLIYDNHKANRLGRRLPISEATAAVIVAQQERTRARFPDTPAAELMLLPTPQKNPDGRKPITGHNLPAPQMD
jgi:hypothetical protein